MAEKEKDLRGAKGELRESLEENSRLGEKLSDVQAQKKKFSRLAREKAEEMGKRGGWLLVSLYAFYTHTPCKS